MNKVFCINCKHNWNGIACEHPDNHYEVETYYSKSTLMKAPSKLNKNNDCKWFEQFVPNLSFKDKVIKKLEIFFGGR